MTKHGPFYPFLPIKKILYLEKKKGLRFLKYGLKILTIWVSVSWDPTNIFSYPKTHWECSFPIEWLRFYSCDSGSYGYFFSTLYPKSIFHQEYFQRPINSHQDSRKWNKFPHSRKPHKFFQCCHLNCWKRIKNWPKRSRFIPWKTMIKRCNKCYLPSLEFLKFYKA